MGTHRGCRNGCQELTELGGHFYDETIQQSDGYAIFKIDARYKYY